MSTQPYPPKRRRWVIFIIVLVVFFSLPIIVASAVIGGLKKGATVERGSVLTLSLRGGIGEAPADPFLAKLGQASAVSMWGIRDGLRRAATDERITSLLVVIEPLGLGWAQAQELVDLIDQFREESHKPVHALLRMDLLEEKEYYLATAADRIWLTPGAGSLLNGLAAEVLFWRGTFEKLHVEPEVIMFHEYKSAGEPYSRHEMSEYFRESLGAVLEDMYGTFLDRVVARRGITREALVALIDQGMTVDQALVDAGLVDQLGYVDEVEALLAGLSGEAGDKEFKQVSLESYLDQPALPQASPDRIAVVFAEGPIVSSAGGSGLFDQDNTIHGPAVAGKLRDAFEDEAVKAVVFRVSSPGGSAVGSDLVWREVKRLREAGKPVVVSMSTVAGSGGYWIAMAADRIVAEPTTITGSIGVVFQKFDVSGLLEMIGAHADTVSVGAQSSLLSFTQPLTPERRARVTSWMEQIYGTFTQKVATGRDLPLEKVQEIAKGRIWSGADAKELGLVNELGGLDEAIALARQLSGVGEDVPAVPYPEEEGFLQRLLQGDMQVVMPLVTGLPDEAQLQKTLVELARPEVRAQMPDVMIH